MTHTSLKILVLKALLGCKKLYRGVPEKSSIRKEKSRGGGKKFGKGPSAGEFGSGTYTPRAMSAPLQLKEPKETESEMLVSTVKKLKKEEVEGIDISSIREFYMLKEEEECDLRTIEMKYPLIPRHPKEGERIFAYAHIRWSEKDNALIYYVIEPYLTDAEKVLLEKIKKIIAEKLDVDFSALKKEEAKEYLRKKFEEIINTMLPNLPKQKRENLLYYVVRDFLGLGKIEPLMHDPNIEDISCDGVGIPVFVNHRNPKIGSIRTNIVFETAEELDNFVIKLAQRCGKTISVAHPLLDATLPDGSRLQATLGTDIARRGSNFTIRKFTEEPFTPITLMQYGTVDAKLLAYLWFIVEHRGSLLIGGGTATGKTTMLNALSLFIPPSAKIVTIEDTAELRLPHLHWVPHVARKAISEFGGKKLGEVDMFDLLAESLRQRPDYIIVGEVRGKEAYVLFQQMATGHAGLATIHADTMEKLVDRLTTPPISLPGSLLEVLDAVVFISRIKRRRSYVRRVTGIHEIVGYDKKTEAPVINTLFEWDAMNDRFITVSKSATLKKFSKQLGIPEEEIKKNIAEKVRILEWLYENSIDDYKRFSYFMNLYYTNRNMLLRLMGEPQ